MRILVTGAGGLVGRTVATGLADLGHIIRGHDIRDLQEVQPAVAARCDEVMRGDLGEWADSLTAVQGVDAVVHLGGSPGVQGDEDPA